MKLFDLFKGKPKNTEPSSLSEIISTGVDKGTFADGGDYYAFSITQKELIPKFVETQNKEFISYGEKNNFPTLLVECMNSSPTHAKTFQKVKDSVAGKGIRIKDNKEDTKLQSFIDRCNSKGECLHDVISKIAYDYAFYNGWTSSVNWKAGAGMEGVSTNFELFHTDWSTIRPAKPDKLTGVIPHCFFSQNWSTWNPVYTPVPSFDVNNPTGTQLYRYMKYATTQVAFPTPRYFSAIGSILIDSKMTEFFNSYLDSGAFPSLFINICENVKDPEKRKAIVNELMSQVRGAAKAGKIFVGFSTPEGKPLIEKLESNNDDDKFKNLRDWIRSQIIIAWSNTSELTGAPTPGRLGNSDLLTQQLIFERDVTAPLRNDIEKEINYLLRCAGFKNEIEIIPYPPIFTPSEDLIKTTWMVDEIRELSGKEKIGGEIGKIIPGLRDKKVDEQNLNDNSDTTQPKNLMKEDDETSDEKTSTN